MSDRSHAPKAPKAIVEHFEPSAESVAASDARAQGDVRGGATSATARSSEPRGMHADQTAGSASSAAPKGTAGARKGFQRATLGLFEGLGRTVWAYVDAHPHATLYGIIGFVLAVLILVIGLWDTIVIAVFVFVGVTVGQMRDGDNALVNRIRRMFDR